MDAISHYANETTLHWLLEEDNPSVRYYTLTQLLHKNERDNEVVLAKQAVMNRGIVPKILKLQHPDGYWGSPKGFYLEKYTGTIWQLIILAELGSDPENEQIKKACEFILNYSQDKESYGFSMNASAKNGGGRHSEVIPCLTGNMLWSLIVLGYDGDSRVQKGIEWICNYQRCDDGTANPPVGWPYDKYETCWGRHTCHMGVVKSLKALAALPRDKQTPTVMKTIHDLSEFILIHHIYKKSHELSSVAKPGWLRPGFPLMYQTDIVEILEILTDLGIRDERMRDASDVLKAKQTDTKKWNLENTFNGKFLVDIEGKSKPSKWLTLKALKILAAV